MAIDPTPSSTSERPALTPAGARLGALIDAAEDGLLWLARRRLAKCSGPIDRARVLRDDIAPLLAKQPLAAREAYLAQLAPLFGLGKQVFREAVLEALAPGEATPRGRSGAGKGSTPQAHPPQGGEGSSSGATSPDAAVVTALQEFDSRHFKVWFGSSSYVGRTSVDDDGRETVLFVTAGDLTRYYSHVRLPVWNKRRESWDVRELAKEWLDWPLCRTFERVAFRPDGRVGEHTFNLWRGLGIQPAPGDCGLYWRHVFEVICSADDDLYLYVRRWLAHTVQFTAELPEVALVLRGLQGVGKGWFVRPLLEIFGSHALSVHSMEHVSGRFNSHLKDVILLFADEAFWGGDRSREGLIKALVTERKRLVEPKNKDAQQVDAFTRLILATNSQWPVAADWDDRRFLFLDVDGSHKEDAGYFGALAAQMANGGTAALLHDLLNEDLAGWHPRQKPQRSSGFDVKLLSSSPAAQWWFECLRNGSQASAHIGQDGEEGQTEPWNETPTVAGLHRRYRLWAEEHRKQYLLPPHLFGLELRKMAPHLRSWRPPENGRTGPRRYRLDSLEDCRTAFERFARVGPEVWADDQAEREVPF